MRKLFIGLGLLLCAAPQVHAQNVFANVPEASSYQLVYRLNIGTGVPTYNTTGVPYTVNNAAAIANGSFNRVAYYLELSGSTKANSRNGFVYISFDAAGFTNQASKIGVPNTSSGEFYQQNIGNMNVVSNVAGIFTGTGLAGGNVEFWHFDYNTSNAAGVPNASGSTYDWGDQPLTRGNYGSMQIANHAQKQMLLSFNAWGGDAGQVDELGIGNSPTGNPDWTFRHNAGDYTFRDLEILVHPIGATSVPEPGSVALLAGIGATGLLALRRRRKANAK